MMEYSSFELVSLIEIATSICFSFNDVMIHVSGQLYISLRPHSSQDVATISQDYSLCKGFFLYSSLFSLLLVFVLKQLFECK